MSMFQFSTPSNPNPNQSAPSFGFGSSMSAPAATTTTGFTFSTTGTGFGGLTSTASPVTTTLFETSTPTKRGFTFPTTGTGFGGLTSTASNLSASPATTLFGTSAATTTGFTFPTTGTGFGGLTSTASNLSASPATTLFGTSATTTTGFTFPTTGTGFGGLTSTASNLSASPATTLFATSTATPSFSLFGNAKTTLTTASTVPIMSIPSTSLTKLTSTVTTATVTPTPAATATTNSVVSTTIQPTTTSTVSTGLGGVQALTNIDPSQALSVGGGTVGIAMRSEERTIKESLLPVELIELVEELKTHIKSETGKLAELSRTSNKSINKVSDVCETVKQQLTNTSNLIHRQILNCDSLRALVDKDNKDAAMAQVTHDTPAALQHDHRLPYAYLFKRIQNYQEKIIIYRKEVLKAESALRPMENTNPLSSSDLCTSLKSTKDSLILLAAKVKTVHEQVVNEVETHRNLLRFVHVDTARDIFTDRGKNLRQTGPPSSLDNSIDYLSKTNILFPSIK